MATTETPKPTLEELFNELHGKGYYINNLCEFIPRSNPPGDLETRWTCSLMRLSEKYPDGEDFYEYGQGTTPITAIQCAIHNADVMTRYSPMMAKKKVRRYWDNTSAKVAARQQGTEDD